MSGSGITPGAPRRALDLAVAGVGLLVCVLLSPLLVGFVIAIRLSSPGPILFRQTRVGQGGRAFTMYKFRSMTIDGGPEITAPNDPRITGVGRILRKTKLDELPQLFNLLRGHMTLVGPRPETPRLAARYESDQAVVFRYRPGVTGLVQIYMPDSEVLPADVSNPEDYYIKELVPVRVAMDLQYLYHPTLLRTLEILAKSALFLITGPRCQRRSKTGQDRPALSVFTRRRQPRGPGPDSRRRVVIGSHRVDEAPGGRVELEVVPQAAEHAVSHTPPSERSAPVRGRYRSIS